MTIHPAGATRPRVPSHRVEVGRDSLVLLSRRDEFVIYDDDVHSIRTKVFAKRNRKGPLGTKALLPTASYCVTTIVHGDDKTITRIRLPWSSEQEDRMDAYRLRVANKVADRLFELVCLNRSVGGEKWHVQGGKLHFQDGRAITLRQVTDVRFFGDDAAVWTDSATPIRIASDEQDQLALTELLRRYAHKNSNKADPCGPVGKTLFVFRSDARCVLIRLCSRIKSSAGLPMLVVSATIAAFFLVATGAGAVHALGGLPGPGDWKRIPPLPILFLAVCFFALLCMIFDVLRELGHEFLRSRRLKICERGILIEGFGARTVLFNDIVLFDDIVGFALQSECVYHDIRFAYTKHHLRLSIAKDAGDEICVRDIFWYEPIVSRGEIHFLVQLLTVATAGKHAKADDSSAGTRHPQTVSV